MTLKKKQLINKLKNFTIRPLSTSNNQILSTNVTRQVHYTRGQLAKMKVRELKALAESHEPPISLRGLRLKPAIVGRIADFFLHESGAGISDYNRIIDMQPLPKFGKFEIVTNPQGYIDVKPWFKDKLQSKQSLDRALRYKKFNQKLVCYCDDNKLDKSLMLTEINGQLFLPKTLAVLLAGDLCARFGIYIAQFFLESLPSEMEKLFMIEMVEMGGKLRDAGLTARFNTGWPDFNAAFAIY